MGRKTKDKSKKRKQIEFGDTGPLHPKRVVKQMMPTLVGIMNRALCVVEKNAEK